MTIKCRPFYSMQEIIQNGKDTDFHRKFGALTKGRHGVYIWGFAKETPNLSEESKGQLGIHWPSDPMNKFAVDVESKNIGIYYVGKVESKNLNVFERIMQERANLFGGFYPIFEWDTYFHNTPMLHMHSQLGDKIARKEKLKIATGGKSVWDKRIIKHMKNLDRYEKCSNNSIFKDSPELYSNAGFNQNNIFDRISPGGHISQKLVDSLKNMSEKFIFTWIEIDIPNPEETKQNIKKLESELINCLGVNVFGIGSKYALSIHEFDSLYELKNVDWTANQALKKRIEHINKKSLELKDSPCGCFK